MYDKILEQLQQAENRIQILTTQSIRMIVAAAAAAGIILGANQENLEAWIVVAVPATLLLMAATYLFGIEFRKPFISIDEFPPRTEDDFNKQFTLAIGLLPQMQEEEEGEGEDFGDSQSKDINRYKNLKIMLISRRVLTMLFGLEIIFLLAFYIRIST